MNVFVLCQMSVVNGANYTCNSVCSTREVAERLMLKEIEELAANHYKGLSIDGDNDYFMVQRSEDFISIDDPYAQYSECFFIDEKSVIE